MNDQSMQNEVILGVDTHLDTYVAAIISHAGKLLGTFATPTNTIGYLKLLAWAPSWGCVRRAGVEGTGTYGAGLARVLREQGLEVLEVNRPDRAKRRLQGKSDPTDAENAQFFLATQLLFQSPSPAPQKLCALFPLPGEVQSRRKQSIS